MGHVKKLSIFLGLLLFIGALNASPSAFGGGVAPIATHTFLWTDPVSGGQIQVTENVLQGCSDAHPSEFTFEYSVLNLSYEPSPPDSNGLSGWQLIFNQQIPELHNQMSPTIGGTWMQNAFSGSFPPFGAEWDVMNSGGAGILMGQTGVFSFCTDPRQDIVVNQPPANPLGPGPNGWAHTWTFDFQDFLFNGPNSIPGDLIPQIPVGGTMIPLDTTALLLAGVQSISMWMIPVVIAGVGIGVFVIKRSK